MEVELLSLANAEAQIGVPRATLRRWCKNREKINGFQVEGVQTAKGTRKVWQMSHEVVAGIQKALAAKDGQTEYATLYDEWVAALRSGLITKRRRPASEATIANFGWGIRYLWQYSGEPESLKNLTYDTVLAAMLAITQERWDPEREKDGYSIKERVYSAVRSFYRLLIHKGLRAKADLLALEDLAPQRGFKANPKLITEAQYEEIMAANEYQERGRDDDGYHREAGKTILMLARHGALRKSEIPRIMLDDVDLANAEISVLGKGNKRAPVGIPPELVEQLHRWITEYRPPSPWRNLIVKIDGQPGTGAMIRGRVRRLSRKTKIPCTSHSFRHLYGSHHANNGVPMPHIQVNMRHSHLETTLRNYVHSDQKAALEAFKKRHVPPVTPPEKPSPRVRF